MTGELTGRRKTGAVRPSLPRLHVVSGEDPFAQALCRTRPRRGWSAPVNEPPTCRVCAGKWWLKTGGRRGGGVTPDELRATRRGYSVEEASDIPGHQQRHRADRQDVASQQKHVHRTTTRSGQR